VIDLITGYVLPAAFAILPPPMRSREAVALLLAIGLQESRFTHRRQVGGPARSFWQFEQGGVRGVLEHASSRHAILLALESLEYSAATDPSSIMLAIEHNDILAACFARCLLWTLPAALPGPAAAAAGWDAYTAAWRPGKPRFDTWAGNYAVAWGAVLQGRQPPTPPQIA
jgi:hypothetical protein